MTESDLSRRLLIKGAIALLALGSFPGCTNKTLSNDNHMYPLNKAVADSIAAKRFADNYLSIYPDEKNVELVYNAVMNSLQKNTNLASTSDLSNVLVGLEQAIRADYIQGEIVKVEGWILSRTEVRLYVLATYNYN